MAPFAMVVSAVPRAGVDLGSLFASPTHQLVQLQVSFEGGDDARQLAKQALALCPSAATGVGCVVRESSVVVCALDSSWRGLLLGCSGAGLVQAVMRCLDAPGRVPGPYQYLVAFPQAELLDEEVTHVAYYHDRTRAVNHAFPKQGAVIIPGSFNPVHAGHLRLAAIAAQRFPLRTVAFELSVSNADKGSALHAYESRLAQFASHQHVCVVTKASLFVQKAALFPGSVFVLGADTAVRLVDPKYYSGAAAGEMMVSVGRIVFEFQCSFLVAGRVKADGEFTTCRAEVEAALPVSLSSAFAYLTEQEFRVDLSSTELRKSRGQS